MAKSAKIQVFVTSGSPTYRSAFAAHFRLDASWQNLQKLRGLYLSDNRGEALARFGDLYLTGELP